MNPDTIIAQLTLGTTTTTVTADGHALVQTGAMYIRLTPEQFAAVVATAPLADSWREYIGGTR